MILNARARLRPGWSTRAEIEEAAQFALDTADRLIALLDGMKGGPDYHPGNDNLERFPLELSRFGGVHAVL